MIFTEKYAALTTPNISLNHAVMDPSNISINIHFRITVNFAEKVRILPSVNSVKLVLIIFQRVIKPATYTLSLEAIDGEPDPESFSSLPVAVSVSKFDDTVTVLDIFLPRRRLWLYSVLPNNCSGINNSISSNNELSEYCVMCSWA